jgi:hypothetical protein
MNFVLFFDQGDEKRRLSIKWNAPRLICSVG